MSQIPHISTPEGRTVDHESFMQLWEDSLKSMTKNDAANWLAQTSPHHPKENMRWLYDRLLMHIAGASYV